MTGVIGEPYPYLEYLKCDEYENYLHNFYKDTRNGTVYGFGSDGNENVWWKQGETYEKLESPIPGSDYDKGEYIISGSCLESYPCKHNVYLQGKYIGQYYFDERTKTFPRFFDAFPSGIIKKLH